MKKFLSLALALMLVLSSIPVFASAAEPAEITVTVANQGALVVVQQNVTVTDTDSDGKLTVNDVLYCTHEKFYEGGAKAGYKTQNTLWGLSLYTLWGVTNGGSYGYYVNSESAYSLKDEVKNGDYVDAFVYKDAKTYTDIYTFFDSRTAVSKKYEEFTLSLYKYTYDENYNAVKTPVSGAIITVDGKDTKYTTDENGKVTININDLGEHTVSAKSASGPVLVPPVCKVTTEKSSIISLIKYIFKMITDWFSSVFSK